MEMHPWHGPSRDLLKRYRMQNVIDRTGTPSVLEPSHERLSHPSNSDAGIDSNAGLDFCESRPPPAGSLVATIPITRRRLWLRKG
jgi:hypothetical protein